MHKPASFGLTRMCLVAGQVTTFRLEGVGAATALEVAAVGADGAAAAGADGVVTGGELAQETRSTVAPRSRFAFTP